VLPVASEENPMQRVCFLLKVKADRLDEYKRRHAQVWPDMLKALSDTGWHNYSLFLREDGLLVGFLETENFQAALDGMSKREVNQRWQTEMAPFFEQIGEAHADQAMVRLEEVFHLD
jgi:L-rhamnose mutarotase